MSLSSPSFKVFRALQPLLGKVLWSLGREMLPMGTMPEVKQWLDLALYDLDVAEDMLRSGHFPYVVFLCHLAVEKALKAKVQEKMGRTPPKIHDLVTLLKLAELIPPEHIRDFIGKLSGTSTAVRYPPELSALLSVYTEEVARGYLEEARRTVAWIREQLKL